MDEKILNELLKHLQKYQIVYQYIGTHGYRPLEIVKTYLMNNCNVAESTARLWVNEIRKNNGLFWYEPNGDTIEFNDCLIADFEDKLQEIFRWQNYDRRGAEKRELEEEIERLTYEKWHGTTSGPLDQKHG